MNTPKEGQFRWMIFKDGKDWIGTALEFNITVTGNDPRVVEAELHEAASGYIEAAKGLKNIRPQKISPILNQTAEDEYEERWSAAQKSVQQGVPSPLSSDMYKFGVANLAAA